jgi:hypothetical protein
MPFKAYFIPQGEREFFIFRKGGKVLIYKILFFFADFKFTDSDSCQKIAGMTKE